MTNHRSSSQCEWTDRVKRTGPELKFGPVFSHKWIFNFELTILEVFSNGPWWNRNRFKQGTKADRFVLNNNMRRIIRSFTDFWITILIFVVHFWLLRVFLSFKFNEPFIVFYDVFWCSWSMVGHKKDNGLDSSKRKFNSCVPFCLSKEKRVFLGSSTRRWSQTIKEPLKAPLNLTVVLLSH